MKDPRKMKNLTEEEARNIIQNVDVPAFLEWLPWEMDDRLAAERLITYRDNFLPLGWNSAKTYLGFSAFLGASRAPDLCQLYALANDIDLQKDFGIDMYFANPTELVGEMIGIFQPDLPTPRSVQGLRLEPVLRDWLASEYGYEFDSETLQKFKDFNHPDHPLMKATPDGFVSANVKLPNGRRQTVKAILELKCTVHNNNYQTVLDPHFFQNQQQLLIADAAGIEADCAITVYYDFDRGLLHPIVVERNMDIRQMIVGGYELAIDHIEAKQLPMYKSVDSPVEMTRQQREDIFNKAHLLGSVSFAAKELTEVKTNLESALKQTIISVTPLTEQGELNTKRLFSETPLPPSAFNATSSLKLNAEQVEELSKKRGIHDKFKVPIEAIADFKALKAVTDEAGIDLTAFQSFGFDHKGAADALEHEHKIHPRQFSDVNLRVFSKDASNLKNAAAAEYSQAMKASVKSPIAQALATIVETNALSFDQIEKEDLSQPKQQETSESQGNALPDKIKASQNDLFSH